MKGLEELTLAHPYVQDALIILGELSALIILYLVLSTILSFMHKRVKRLAESESQQHAADQVNRFVLMILRLTFLVLFLLVLGVNAYILYQGQEVKTQSLAWIHKIPPDFWKQLSISFIKVVGLIILARYLIRFFTSLLSKLKQKAVDYKQLRRNDQSVGMFFDRLSTIVRVSVWLMVIYIATQLFPLPESVGNYVMIACKVYVIISIGLLIVNAVAAIVDSLDELSLQYAKSNDLLAIYDQLRHLIPVLRKTLEYIVYASVATLVLKQLSFIAHLAEYGPGVIQGIGLIFIARVVVEVINFFVDRRYLNDSIPEQERQQNETIYPILKNILAGMIYFVVVILILRGLGFDPLPLLAGAGILGMVIGLGAQELVNDIVSGFFIVLDRLFKVGDYIQVGEASGRVESISLRTTRIRSNDGQLYILRNGQMEDVVNFSYDYTNAVVEVGVDPETDLKKVYAVLDKVGQDLQNEFDQVIEPTRIDGVEDFSGPELVIRTVTKVQPGCHKLIERECRQRIIAAFQTEEISIPFDKRYQLA